MHVLQAIATIRPLQQQPARHSNRQQQESGSYDFQPRYSDGTVAGLQNDVNEEDESNHVLKVSSEQYVAVARAS